MERIHPERLRRSAIPCRRIHYPPDSLRYGPRDLVALPRAVELAHETLNGRPGVIWTRVGAMFGSTRRESGRIFRGENLGGHSLAKHLNNDYSCVDELLR